MVDEALAKCFALVRVLDRFFEAYPRESLRLPKSSSK
jgi:hypothetical protein